MLATHEVTVDTDTPPTAALPPLRFVRQERRVWMDEDHDREPGTAALPAARRVVVPRTSKLSLTDTIAMLRARGQREPDGRHVASPEDAAQERATPTVSTWLWRGEMNERDSVAISRGRHCGDEDDDDHPYALLTLADTITLPSTRARRSPASGPSASRPQTSRFENIAFASSYARNSSRADIRAGGCCASPESAVRYQQLPRHAMRSSSREDRPPFEPPFNVSRDRHLLQQEEGATPFPRQRSVIEELPVAAAALRIHGPDRYSSSDSPTSATRDLGFSLEQTLTLPKAKARRPMVARGMPVPARAKSEDNDEDDEDDERPCCLGPEFEITEGMTPDEIRQVKKARRKEQCRINQANYRKRKRALEMQTDHEIQQLQDEIQQLQEKRDIARRRARHVQESELQTRDPMHVVQHVYLQLSPTQMAGGRRQARAPLRQVDAIVGLGYEEFASVDELLAQWKYHHSVFEIFELRLRSVRGEQLGDLLVLSAEATLRSSIVARPLRGRDDSAHRETIVVCPVVQRFVFGDHHHALVKVISEVDWLAGLRAHSPSPLAVAADLVASSSPRFSSEDPNYT